MKTIHFNLNWNNKLTNQCFTAILPRNDEKYIVGQDYQIGLDRYALTTATIIEVRHYTIARLSEYMCRLDSGFSKAETITMLMEKYGHSEQVKDWATFEFSYLLFHNTNIGLMGVQYSDQAENLHIHIQAEQPTGQLQLGITNQLKTA